MWSLYNKDKFLEPLCFSSGKSQKDVVKEVLEAMKEHKIVFIHGACGTGKSAIALNIARKIGKTSIIVPGKNLQGQYKKDYEGDKYLLGENNKKLKISVMTGRRNHLCKFLEDQTCKIPVFKKEVNSKLNNIFEFSEEELEKKKNKEKTADVWDLPCKIEIKEKNWWKLKEYIRQNKNVDSSTFNDISDVTRSSVAGVCPYWSPVLPEKFELKSFPDSTKRKYLGLDSTKFVIHRGKPGCEFYEKFNSYLDSDVIVFNSAKYVLESMLNRKPSTEAEIIDECDEFLDNFSNTRSINLDRLQTALIYAIGDSVGFQKGIEELSGILKQLKGNSSISKAIDSEEVLPLKKTGIYDLLEVFAKKGFLEEVDESSYLFDVEETSQIFKDFLDETYVTFSRRDGQVIASVVTTNLAKKFKSLVDKNKRIIMMSGTLHSENVLKKIFGIEDFKVIEAEVVPQGKIEVFRTGSEMDCKYANFSSGKFTREQYLKALSKCVSKAKKPSLVHIHAFSDLPSEEELIRYNLSNLISREKLRELQEKDSELVDKFKNGDVDVLFSTRASRGIDFPGDQCNSIIFTKYPNPNVRDVFWRILNQTRPQDYWEFYKDKARRELLQKVYRGVRSQDDHVYVLSPDSRVLDGFE